MSDPTPPPPLTDELLAALVAAVEAPQLDRLWAETVDLRLAARTLVKEVKRLQAENARLRRDLENEPYEELLEEIDGRAHEFLEGVGRGHRKPACYFGDGPDAVAAFARELLAAHRRLKAVARSVCDLLDTHAADGGGDLEEAAARRWAGGLRAAVDGGDAPPPA